MRQLGQVLMKRLVADELAEASFAVVYRGGDRVHFSQALLGGQGRGVQAGKRRGRLLHELGHLDRLFGREHVQIGDLGRAGLSRGQLDELGADQALGDDPRHGVGANQPSQAFIDPQDQLDRAARLAAAG